MKFKYKYIDRITKVFNDKNKDADHLQWGSYVHRIFELGEDAEDVKDLEIIAKEERSNYHFNETRLKELPKIFRNFISLNKKIKNNSVGSEIEFEIWEEDIKTHTNGKIDRIVKGKDGRYLIIDYKTGKPKNRTELLRDPQLVLYIFAVCKLYNTDPSRIRVAHFYPHKSDELVSLAIPPMIVENVRKKYKSTIWKVRKLKNSELKPTLNEFCNWCDFKGICRLHTPKLLVEKRLEDYAEEKKLLDAIEEAKSNNNGK